MPNCPKCGQEVDLDQKMCAWCGEELRSVPIGAKAPPPRPTSPAPPVPAAAPPQPAHKGPSAADARELAKRGDLAGAVRLFNQILESDPHNEEALFGVGGVHFKKGEHKRAAEVWLRLKVLDPNYPKIDTWIEQAQKHLSPSSQRIESPPAKSPSSQRIEPPTSKTPSSASFGPPKPAPRVESSPGFSAPEDVEWQKQSVRVDHIDEQALAELPKSDPQRVPKSEEIIGVGRDRNTIQGWVVQMGWGLCLLFLAMIWGLYFL